MKEIISGEDLRRQYFDDALYPLYEQHFKELSKKKLLLQIEEMLKFLYLMSRFPKMIEGFLPVSREIDETWHFYILQTMEYATLCKNLPGGFFLHHRSVHFSVYSQIKDRKQIMREFLKWLTPYCEYFGHFQNDRAEHWFAVKMLMKNLGLSLEKINQLAMKKEKDHPKYECAQT